MPFPRKLIVADVPIPSTKGSNSRVFSHPPDVRCLTPLGPLIPRSHPLTFLHMFRTNVLDLTRDNHASIPFPSSRSYRLVFVCLVNLFVIVNRRSQSMLPLLVDTTADAFDRPTVLSVSCPPPPHPKGRSLIPFPRFSVVASSHCDMLWSSPRPSLSSGCSMYESFHQIKFLFCQGESAVHLSIHLSLSLPLNRRRDGRSVCGQYFVSKAVHVSRLIYFQPVPE